MMLKSLLIGPLLLGTVSVSQAEEFVYAGKKPEVGNCIPFGCPDEFGPHMGFIYKNIAPFTLDVGDTIAFDTGVRNDKLLQFDLSLAATSSNGGETPNQAGFTPVSSLGRQHQGDNIVGNYDLVFVVRTAFSFAGGGFIVDFRNTNGQVQDGTPEQNLVYSSDNPYTVRRYFSGMYAGDISRSDASDGPVFTGNMLINTNPIPEPASVSLFALGLAGILIAKRRSSPSRRALFQSDTR